MELPPALVIHGLPHARLARSFGRPVTLLSAPGAALFAGCGWWRAVVEAAGAGPDVLDCGDAPGRALEALAVGCRILVLRPGPSFAAIMERAVLYDATVLPERPPALDLARRHRPGRVEAWLNGDSAAGFG